MEDISNVYDVENFPELSKKILEKLIEEGKWALPEEHIKIYFSSDEAYYKKIIDKYSNLDTFENIKNNIIQDMCTLQQASIKEFNKELHESINAFAPIAIQKFVKKKENLKKIEALQKEFLSYVSMFKSQEIDKVKLLIIAQKAFTKDEINQLCEDASKSFKNRVENLINEFINALISINQ